MYYRYSATELISVRLSYLTHTFHYKYAKGKDVSDIINSEVTSRIFNFGIGCLEPLTHIFDTIVGIYGGGVSIMTLGTIPEINKFAKDNLLVTQDIVANPFFSLIKALNPKAAGETVSPSTSGGLLTRDFKASLIAAGKSCTESMDDFVTREIHSRVIFGITAVVCVILRVIDAVFAAIFSFFALVALGKWDSMNKYAYRAMQFPGILLDIYECTRLCINPYSTDKIPDYASWRNMELIRKIVQEEA